MRTQNLFYPVWQAVIGKYSFGEGISIEVFSDKKYLYDWARIRFTRQFNGNISLDRGDEALIRMGYDGRMQDVFRGIVAKSYNKATFKDEILLKDYTLKLEDARISGTFLEVTPQDLVRQGLMRAGIGEARLGGGDYPVKKKVAVREKTVAEYLMEVDSLWGIKTTKSFLLGVFYWNEKPEQDDMYLFEYGNNIISLTREQRLWKLETVAVPAVQHSRRIGVKHPEISGTFEVEKVIFSSDDRGFARTKIFFEG